VAPQRNCTGGVPPHQPLPASSYKVVHARGPVGAADLAAEGISAGPCAPQERHCSTATLIWQDRRGLTETTGPLVTAEAVQSRVELGRALTVLRLRCGLTVRQLAVRMDVPAATLGGYFSGRHLPGPGSLGLFRSLLDACGVPDDDVGPWLDALARARLSSDARVALPPCPYRGLEPYQVEDAAMFCGREVVTSEVLEYVDKLAQGRMGPSGLLVVVGPSGSGKSSLLCAGVVPAVRAGSLDRSGRRWAAEVITPDLGALELYLSCPGPTPRLVIVDQMEEIFRLPGDERRRFLARLAALEPSECVAIAVLRADFYEAATREPVLLAALKHNHIVVGPMAEEELSRAIVGPAKQVGVGVEEGLVELLITDLAPRNPTGFAYDAGALPLLSYALLATWDHAQRNQLTVGAYRAAGGLRGAVRQRAEELYLELGPEEQVLARRLFCRLVNVEDEVPLTRRRMANRELDQLGDGAIEVLGRFVSARLVTADASGVEVSHEALITAWPRLADWLDDDRAGLRLHHELSDATNRWLAAARDTDLLQRGSRLALTSEWAAQAGADELQANEWEFLRASQQLETAELRDARMRTRRAHQLLALVAALAVAASVLAGVALNARSTADRVGNEALSRQVAIEASELEATDPALAMQLALAAYRISPTVQARSTLLDASASEMPTRLLAPVGPTSLAVGDYGHLLAVAASASDEVAIYSLGATARPVLLANVRVATPPAETFTVALSPDGRLLAAGGTSGVVTVFDLSRPGRPVLLASLHGFNSTVYDLTFGPQGRSLAAADNDGSVREWDFSRPSRPSLIAVTRAPSGASLQAVGFSPGGRLLAAAGADGTLLVWRSGEAKARVVPGSGSAQLTSVAFSPDGKLLATGGEDDLVRLFAVAPSGAVRPVHPPLAGFSSWVDSLAFTPDGSDLVAGSSDNSLREWSTSTWAPLAVLEHTAPVTAAVFLPSGRTLVTADADGTVRLWSMPPPSTYVAPGPVFTVDYTADGRMLAAVSGGPRGDVALWDVADPWRPVHIGDVEMPRSFGPVAGVEALSPNGQLLAVGNGAAQIQLVRLVRAHRPKLVGSLLKGATPPIEELALSPQGTVLASGDNSGRAHLWDVSNPAQPRRLSTLSASGYLLGLAFSPNGRLLALGSSNDNVYLWDISRPTHPRLVATVGGFAGAVYAVAFTPNGGALIAGSADDTVRLWDIADPNKPRALGGPLTGPTSYVYSLSVSPDGRTLAASTVDQAVWLWDITDPAHPTVLADLGAATGQVFDVTFSPNGHTVVASGSDQVLTFWDYRPSEVAARICALTVAPITRAEWAEYVQGASYSPPCQ
jgi:WD40 repeat protein/transcriptional regulator with XRE-family HTH domain